MNKLKLMLWLVLLLVLATGCLGREPQSKPMEQPPVHVAFALADLNRDGNKTIKTTVERQKQKMRAQVTWLDAKNNAAEQQKQLQQLLEKKPQVVVLQPVDLIAAPTQIEQLQKAGIKVIALENLPLNTAVDGYIAADYQAVGRLQVRFLLEALSRAQTAKDGATQSSQPTVSAVDLKVVAQLPQHRPLKVIVLQGDPNHQASQMMLGAVQKELQKSSEVQPVGVYQQPGFDPALVTATMAEIMGQGGGVDVIIASDSSLVMAAVEFLQLGGLEKKVLTVGAGADEKASMALVAGQHDAEVDLQPEMLGQFALEAAVSLARTGGWQYSTTVENGDFSVPTRIVPVRLITAKNAYLLQQRWRGLAKAESSTGTSSGGGQQQNSSDQGGGEQQGQGQSQDQGQGQSQSGGVSPKTTLRITTQDGKTMEVQIDGEIKTLESQGASGEQKGGSKQQSK